MKIEKLTEEQIAKFPEYRDKWLKIGLQTSESFDFKLAKQAAIEVYKCVGMKEPEIFINLGSPLEGCIGSYLLNQVGNQVWNQVEDQVWNQVGNQVGNQVWNQVGNQVRDQVGNQVGNQVRNQVGNQVRDQVWNQVGNQVRDQVWNQVRNQVRNQVGNQVRDQVEDQVYKCGYGLQDSSWLSFYDFFKNELHLECCNKLNGLMELSKHSGWWWPFENAVILTPFPTILVRDDEFRLHCENGPALKYPSDFAIYSWHGVRVPSEWIENPEDLDPSKALEWENQEQRRALCEIIGWDRVLNTLECKTIHTDEKGELIETSNIDDGDDVARFVKVIDPSTDRRYALRVPPEINTATSAVAWTFGVEEDTYQPTQES